MKKNIRVCNALIISLAAIMPMACNKLVSISDPVDQVTTNQVFSTNELANVALNGVYYSLIAGAWGTGFGTGNTTLYGGLSADELVVKELATNLRLINTNHIIIALNNSANGGGTAPTDNIWSSAYEVIYKANAVMEGITASTSLQLTDSARKQFIAEAKCLRAFCYFYLTNFYGDVPLVLNTNYFDNVGTTRSSQAKVYQQIIMDLKDAKAILPDNYAAGGGNRVRVSKWMATALLARTYLYMQDYNNAAAEATELINNTNLFNLETDLNNVFLINSREAIWQLNHIRGAGDPNDTPDGMLFLPMNGTINTGAVSYAISSQLLNAFESDDQRKQKWMDSTTNLNYPGLDYFVCKYKIGGYNRTSDPPIEYYMVFRLAEQYLIRAEAEANGAGGGIDAAVDDINIIRTRAGLPGIPDGLSQEELLTAVAKEWQIEFFCEWGHRWFNLKRTGQAAGVLSAIPLKQPWWGDYQLLYPIPPSDIQKGRNLTQNQGY